MPRPTAHKRGYNARWQKARITYLRSNPLCAECCRADRLTPATVVDHIEPHLGDMVKFWDMGNWQPLCKQCHDQKTASENCGFGNAKGVARVQLGCGLDGHPRASGHHWNM